MTDFVLLSDKYKKDADALLLETGLIEDLKKYGKVNIQGSYAGNVMLSGDIDIHVSRANPYSAEEAFNILKDLYLKNKFRSYFIKGDWYDKRIGNEYPNGHYLGLKHRFHDENWKVDIWFVSTEDFEERKKRFLDVADTALTTEQRELILQMKKYRNDNKLNVSSQQIYEAVLKKGERTTDWLKSTDK